MLHTHPIRLLVLMLFLAAPLAAQDSFVIMSVKGKVEYSAGKSKKWKKLEVGSVLRKANVVRTSFSSYAKIMVNNQRLVSIDENSTTPLSSFLKDRSKGGQSSTGKILQFAAEQLNRTKQKQTTSYGAVRGMEGVFSAVFPKYDVRSTDPTFEWVDGNEPATYELILLDENYDIIARENVTGTRMRHGGSPALQFGKSYYWRIRRVSDGAMSDIQSFAILPSDTADAIARELGNLDRELGSMNADEVTTHLIRGIYFEKKGLYNDAFTEYKATVRLAPDVPEYRALLSGLLRSLRLINEEEYLVR